MKLAPGEYERPGDPHRESAQGGRAVFLKLIREQAPEVLAGLRDNVFPHFRELVEPTEEHRVLDDIVGYMKWLPASQTAQFREALDDWSRQWNLDEEWCRNEATMTMRQWLVDEGNLRRLSWWDGSKFYSHPSAEESALSARSSAHALSRELSNDPGQTYIIPSRLLHQFPRPEAFDERLLYTNVWLFMFLDDAWSPLEETRADYEERIGENFGKHLKEYLDRVEEQLREWGMTQTPTKRDATHFDWLVKYQVQSLSMAEIAAAVHADRKSVSDGIKRTAELIGLALRPSSIRPGRPRKNPASQSEKEGIEDRS